jgi:polyribonucleotide nucleotidyltransferase
MKNKFKTNIGGRELIANTENIVEQANGSVFLQYGETLVLATVAMNDSEADVNYFPLVVDYREKHYAKGKIMGSRFSRREGRPSSNATCNGRLIDRSIRPLFPKGIKRRVQVVNTVLAFDEENDPATLGLIASSIALATSDIPWNGPIATVRVGKIKNNFILNPTFKERKECELDIVFAVSEINGEISINMIEGNSHEVDQKEIMKAFSLAKPELKKILEFEKKIIKEIGKEKIVFKKENKSAIEEKFKKFVEGKLEKALYTKGKTERSKKINELKEDLISSIDEENTDELNYVNQFFEEEIDNLMHQKLLEGAKRFDNRDPDDVRELKCRVNFLPKVHGSGLFERGLTKVLSVLTLGSPGDAKLMDDLENEEDKRFMHFYNFPPYSVGEAGFMRGPGRRDIGHGTLGENALKPLIPSSEEFPYTIRIVSEVLSSNGSSSQASISGSSLALMDGGVPIKRHVTGIALGLVSNKKGDYKILTDIQGPEDHYGDMDFKVAGTEKGITAIQMDIKIDGISEKIMKETLQKAKEARLKILKEMNEAIPEPRKELSPNAPRITSFKIGEDKIGTLIGPKGETINEITEKYEVTIDIEDDGTIFLTSENQENAKKALEFIKKITKEVEIGETYEGEVKKILNFGAFVEIIPGTEGLIHISKLSDKRVNKVEDIVNKGDIVKVKVISVDKEKGEIDLALIKK